MIEVTLEMVYLILEWAEDDNAGRSELNSAIRRIIELHEANKPVPFCYISKNTGECVLRHELPVDLVTSGRWESLYTAPPTREQLNGYKIEELWRKCGGDFIAFARAIEQAHGIGYEVK